MDCKDCLYYREDFKEQENDIFLKYNRYCDCGFRESVMTPDEDDCYYYHKSVVNVLKDIEKEYKVRIIYAVESGSRAWGFDNEDSDYDIRFIFKYTNLSDYLRLSPKKEVITYEDGLYDIVGWDIRKAYFLHYKNNPSLREWMLSDYRYIDKENIFEYLPAFHLYGLLHHYFNMAKNNWNDYCEGRGRWLNTDMEYSIIKKYLYVIRCILTWNLLYESEDVNLPQLNIFNLLEQCKGSIITDDIYNDIVCFIDKYKYKKDCLSYTNIDNINDYVVDNLRNMKSKTLKSVYNKNDKNFEVYNKAFYNNIVDNMVLLGYTKIGE